MADTRSETRKRFDTEFAEARKRGAKTFDFDGKSIAVKLADETPQLSNKGMTMLSSAKKLRDTGYDASGNPTPLRDIPKLSNKVEKEDLMGKGLLGNALMRAEIGDEKEEPPTAKYAPKKFGTSKESIKLSSPADEGLEKYMPRKVSTKESLSSNEKAMKRGGKVKSSASSRGDGIATKGFTKGRYI